MIPKKISPIFHRFLKRGWSGITASSRVLPNFIIAGTVRSGTTSLYNYTCNHPSILPAAYDEIGFFDSNFQLGTMWYQSMFPTKKQMESVQEKTNFCLTGEDTPFYFWNKDAIKRISELIPNCKIIMIFRNPVDRAYSNYQLGKRENKEDLSFEKTIEIEKQIINKGTKNLDFSEPRTYLIKSLYSIQLKNWLTSFSKDQLYFLSTEQLSSKPNETMSGIFNFLGLPGHTLSEFKKEKKAIYPEMNISTRNDLLKFFKSYNNELFSLIGKNFSWDK
ncbi:sulfotransferase [Candidatus Nitrosopelagicus sp.]|nr:sulfotransferase [Candidatus Nitrosopelagicus sp.]